MVAIIVGSPTILIALVVKSPTGAIRIVGGPTTEIALLGNRPGELF